MCEDKPSIVGRVIVWALSISSISLVSLFFFWIFFLNHVDPQEVGITYNSSTGDISLQSQPGWHETSFWVRETSVSTLPYQVCLYAGVRVGSCKMVRFVATPQSIKDFVSDQGFHSYNSGNGGSASCATIDQQCYGVPAILMGYAFSNQKRSFYEVMSNEQLSPVQ